MLQEMPVMSSGGGGGGTPRYTLAYDASYNYYVVAPETITKWAYSARNQQFDDDNMSISQTNDNKGLITFKKDCTVTVNNGTPTSYSASNTLSYSSSSSVVVVDF